MKTNQNYGLIISIFIHIVILAIPVSVAMKQYVQEIELFVSVEDARNRQTQVVMKRVSLQPARREAPDIQGHAATSVEEQLLKEPNKEVAEPALAPQEGKTVSVPAVQAETAAGPIEKFGSATVSGSGLASAGPIDTKFGSAIAPVFLHKEIPEYPMLARKLGKEGEVVLRLTIDERGNLVNAEVIEGAGYGFAEAAIEAVEKSTFLPAKKNGKPIASRAVLPIKFKLRRN
ncbi:MAG: energy transducer TonB [Nitrospirota bacterium]